MPKASLTALLKAGQSSPLHRKLPWLEAFAAFAAFAVGISHLLHLLCE
jgi:hypothetical protein